MRCLQNDKADKRIDSINGYEMEYTQKELSDLILDVAADRKQYEDILHWLLGHQM